MYLKINGYEISCEEGVRWLDAYRLLPAERKGLKPLGISVQGRTYSLDDPAEEYAHASVLTYADEEGRRIYERSLQLLFLTAVHRVDASKHVRIEHSFGQGIYIDLKDGEMDDAFVMRVEAEMRALAEQDLPIRRKSVSTA